VSISLENGAAAAAATRMGKLIRQLNNHRQLQNCAAGAAGRIASMPAARA
jgi:hypothetical protein